MPRKKTETSLNLLPLFVVAVCILTLVAAGWIWRHQKQTRVAPEAPAPPEMSLPSEAQSPPVIEYQNGNETREVQDLTNRRKADLGIEESIDLVLKADESLKIGGAVVSMKEILDHIKIKRGEIIEDDLKEKALREINGSTSGKAAGVYGIHVVKTDDNIWNVHFRFLKDYFEKRGISLSPVSDEATADGFSSGVGKILKFSENMVYVYNVKDHRLDVNLDLIHPLSKVVVFDMGRVFALLDQIDYENVNRIQFDGETLWIPAKQ